MLEIGSVIDGKYKILNQIGKGGMSVVYLALNERANKTWAIKEVRKDGVQDFATVKQGLIAETDTLKRLNHKYLPSIIDVIDDEDTFLIVMDYIEGKSLNKVLKESMEQTGLPIGIEDVLSWGIQLCDVLNYLHTRENIISPILANIYMHNVLTLWYKFIITKECKGDNFLIVYADDFVAGFQYKWEAENYYKLLKERMEKFGLQLEDSKSRLLQSGAYIARAKQKSGECIRLQTFDFLGFTFYCGRSRKGMPYIMPKTSSKKFRQKIRDIKVWLYANRDQPLKKLMGMLNLKLIGHYRYYGISFNGRMISNYKQQVRELLFKVLNRRSDRKSYTREGFIEMLKYYPLAMPKIYVSLF